MKRNKMFEPAYPAKEPSGHFHYDDITGKVVPTFDNKTGATILDYFAKAAMESMVEGMAGIEIEENTHVYSRPFPSEIAKMSYIMAKEMVKEKQRIEEQESE